MEELTKKEEEIMLIFWQLEKAFVKEVIAQLSQDPKPPYNTISSIVRILERKGYLGFKKYGNTYQYYPLIEKTAYRKGFMKKEHSYRALGEKVIKRDCLISQFLKNATN